MKKLCFNNNWLFTCENELEGFANNGTPCLAANDEVELSIHGGLIIGVGNGDPSSLDYEQKLPIEKSFRITAFACEEGAFTIPDKPPATFAERDTIGYYLPKRTRDMRTITE